MFTAMQRSRASATMQRARTSTAMQRSRTSEEKQGWRKAVKEWAKTHIFIGQNGLTISHGENIFIKDCKNVNIYGDATVEYICDNATVENIRGKATVENICDNATVENIRGKATVKYIYDNATVISSPYTKWNNSTSMVIDDNATFKDCYSKMIYQAGGWEFVKVTRGK